MGFLLTVAARSCTSRRSPSAGLALSCTVGQRRLPPSRRIRDLVRCAPALLLITSATSCDGQAIRHPAPTPSPSAPTRSADACHPSPQMAVAAQDPALNVVLPNYGFGRSPVYLSGQLHWYGPGSQTAFLLVDPTYSG